MNKLSYNSAPRAAEPVPRRTLNARFIGFRFRRTLLFACSLWSLLVLIVIAASYFIGVDVSWHKVAFGTGYRQRAFQVSRGGMAIRFYEFGQPTTSPWYRQFWSTRKPSYPGDLWQLAPDFSWFGVRWYHYRGWAVVFPLWFLLVLCLIWPSLAVRREIIRRSRTRAGLCAECGYDLRATPQRCPECGSAGATT